MERILLMPVIMEVRGVAVDVREAVAAAGPLNAGKVYHTMIVARD
jgi:hypothetical protein